MIPFPNIVGGHIVAPGSQNFLTPGTYTFVVPDYNTLSVTVNGGGGAGFFDLVIAYAQASTCLGLTGDGGAFPIYGQYRDGVPGSFSGPQGTTGTVGGGGAGVPRATRDYTYCAGGYCPCIGGPMQATGSEISYAGGNGGQARNQFLLRAAGAPVIGASISVVVGAAGSAKAGNGSVLLSWV